MSVSPVNVPSTDAPTPQQMVYMVIQLILYVLGAIGIAIPAFFKDQSAMFAVAGSVATLIGMIVTYVGTHKAAADAHASIIAASKTGQALRVSAL